MNNEILDFKKSAMLYRIAQVVYQKPFKKKITELRCNINREYQQISNKKVNIGKNTKKMIKKSRWINDHTS